MQRCSGVVKALALSALLLCRVQAQTVGRTAASPVDLVHPLVGTSNEGQTFPSVGVPFAMTGWTPQTREGETKCVAPYYYNDTKIQGFRGSHFLSGSCAQEYGSFTVMPLRDSSRLGAADRASEFSHNRERATPYQYGVDLLSSGIHAEITGTLRAGIMEFHYPARATEATLAIESNVRLGAGTLSVDAAHGIVTGSNPVHRIYAGSGLPAGFAGHLVAEIDAPIRAFGTWDGTARHNGVTAVSSTAAPVVWVTVALPRDRIVRVRLGTSFTSADEARRNLQAEIPDWNFASVAAAAKAAWQRQLARIDVAGNDRDRTVFYTALYHASLVPRVQSDSSGAYPRFGEASRVEHASGWTMYDDYSAWDTFRGVHPMFTIIDPERDSDMVRSLVTKGEQGGFLPIFPMWNSYTSAMVGDHATAIIADAYAKGIRGFDAESAWRLMLQNATATPGREQYRNGEGRRALEDYKALGYVPLENPVDEAFHRGEQVSRTLEYAYDDFVVSEFGRALGHSAEAEMLRKRSAGWRNVIDPETGFARGRHRDGKWDAPFDPTRPYHYITEGLPYQYTFFVPQDVPGLIALEGGNAAFAKKLDGLFDGGFYNHGNEPSHHIAYLYDDAGAPEKTQRRVHEALLANYKDGPGGYSGNDDAGQMSAWYILSALGFYPVAPGVPRYSIGTPRFDRMTIHSPGGKALHITADGAESGSFYVRAVRLNGKKLNRWYLLHSEIAAGGELEFTMARTPLEP